jgi:hypothetical protein
MTTKAVNPLIFPLVSSNFSRNTGFEIMPSSFRLTTGGLWLWYLTPLSIIFQLNHVLLVEETRVPGGTTDLPQVTDKLSHIVV